MWLIWRVGASFYNIRRVVGQLNSSHMYPNLFFIFIEKNWKLAVLGGPWCFCTKPASFVLNRSVWRKPSGFIRNRTVQPWNRPILYGTSQKRFESMIWIGEACKPVQPGGLFKIGCVLITLLLLYVDDLFLTGNEKQIAECKKKLTEEFWKTLGSCIIS